MRAVIRERQRRWVLVALVALCAACGSPRKELLREVPSPTFRRVPPPMTAGETIARLGQDARSDAAASFWRRVVPDQAGVLWLSLILTLAVAWQFDRSSPRNLDLLLLQALGWCFFEILRFFRVLEDAAYLNLLDVVFTAIVALNLALLVRALLTVVQRRTLVWKPNLPPRPLAAIAVVLVVMNCAAALVRPPDDAGWFINLGAQRLRERGHLPYGDPLLTSTPAAAYGPVLYALHVPFLMAVSPQPVNTESPDRPVLGDRSRYFAPPALATKLCTIALHLLGVAALFAAARLVAGAHVAWGLVVLYCGSAFIMGVGGEEYFIGGMTFVSHIGPAALSIAAFAAIARPLAAGALLAAAAGAGFYPAFMAPAWAGYYWRAPQHLRRFVAGFVITGALIAAFTFALSSAADGRSRLGTIVHDTLGHHTELSGYGSSPFGFWGQRGGLRGWFVAPLVGDSPVTSPAYLAFFGMIAGCFALARGARPHELALLHAAVAIAAALLKIHATGTYVAWSYPFLLLGLFAQAPPEAARTAHA